MDISPYLSFHGTCRDALNFYAELFGGSIEAMETYGDGPENVDFHGAPDDWVMHGRVRIGAHTIMASDMAGADQKAPQGFHLQTQFDDLDKAKRVFSRLAKNGSITIPFEPTFWATGFGMCVDRFGIPWIVNCETGLPES